MHHGLEPLVEGVLQIEHPARGIAGRLCIGLHRQQGDDEQQGHGQGAPR